MVFGNSVRSGHLSDHSIGAAIRGPELSFCSTARLCTVKELYKFACFLILKKKIMFQSDLSRGKGQKMFFKSMSLLARLEK